MVQHNLDAHNDDLKRKKRRNTINYDELKRHHFSISDEILSNLISK